MRSPVFKEVERRLDAVFVPADDHSPIPVTEFQGYEDNTIYYRVLSSVGEAGIRNPDRQVIGLVFFLERSHDPKTEPWHSLGRSGADAFKVIYLDEAVKKIEAREVGHPLAVLLNLILEPDPERLRERANTDFKHLMSSELEERQRETYGKLYVYWLTQRLKDMTREEVKRMLDISMTPLKETRFYKDIADEVNADRIEKEIKRMNLLRERGALPEEEYKSILKDLHGELEEINIRKAG